MTKTLNEKRVFARANLTAQADRAEALAAAFLARASNEVSFANYARHRAEIVDQISEVEIDLMIRNWQAAVEAEIALLRSNEASHRPHDLTDTYLLQPHVEVAEPTVFAIKKDEGP